ncbi:MAG TPA: hypothetical protein VFH03_11645 [Actinoplanes sp.]|nr:hypothetical protein [Actinoplanes sp.]
MTQGENLEAFGDPESPDTDFAVEHQDSAVDPDIAADQDDREEESPRGWSGMDSEG